MHRWALILSITFLWPTCVANAQDQIRLAEVIPALDGSELGNLSLGNAPNPGHVRVVRRSEVLAALRRADRSSRGLAIPRRTRIAREARELSSEEIIELATPSARETLAPCELEELTVYSNANVAPGELLINSVGQIPQRSGISPLVIVLQSGAQTVRVPGRARVTCPAPIIAPGQRVRLVARFGLVEASTPGIARQYGRPGDIIPVQNIQSHRTLRARVVDEDTVEIIQ